MRREHFSTRKSAKRRHGAFCKLSVSRAATSSLFSMSLWRVRLDCAMPHSPTCSSVISSSDTSRNCRPTLATDRGSLISQRDHPFPLDGNQSISARAVLDKVVIHTEDLADDQLYRDRNPHRIHAVDVEGMTNVAKCAAYRRRRGTRRHFTLPPRGP